MPAYTLHWILNDCVIAIHLEAVKQQQHTNNEMNVVWFALQSIKTVGPSAASNGCWFHSLMERKFARNFIRIKSMLRINRCRQTCFALLFSCPCGFFTASNEFMGNTPHIISHSKCDSLLHKGIILWFFLSPLYCESISIQLLWSLETHAIAWNSLGALYISMATFQLTVQTTHAMVAVFYYFVS